jgi:hypothetical protein
MTKKLYTQPMLVDRGKAVEQTLETHEPNKVEIDMETPTAGTAI